MGGGGGQIRRTYTYTGQYIAKLLTLLSPGVAGRDLVMSTICASGCPSMRLKHLGLLCGHHDSFNRLTASHNDEVVYILL